MSARPVCWPKPADPLSAPLRSFIADDSRRVDKSGGDTNAWPRQPNGLAALSSPRDVGAGLLKGEQRFF